MRVRLVKKFAQFFNGVDLRNVAVEQCADFPEADAQMLLAEGWAEMPDARTPDQLSASEVDRKEDGDNNS